MPAVSIIIPNYNHAPFLIQRIESVLNQTYRSFEVILLDDCSTDNSVSVLESYRSHPKVSGLYVNEKNSGSPFRQWKKGIELAAGEYIWIAESDDYADEQFLETLVPALENRDVVLAYCRSYRVKSTEVVALDGWSETLAPGRWDDKYVNSGMDELRRFLVFRNTIPNASAVLFKKKAIEAISLFPEEMRYCGDWLIWGQIAAQGDIFYSATPLNYFRHHDATTRQIPNVNVASARLREYMEVNLFLRELADLRLYKLAFTDRYDWILDQWRLFVSNTTPILQYLTPPLALPLLIRFYWKLIRDSCVERYTCMAGGVRCHLKALGRLTKRLLRRLIGPPSTF